MDVGTPPQRVAPRIDLSDGPDQLTFLEAPATQDADWFYYRPEKSSTFQSNFSSDVMALNGINKRQELGEAVRGRANSSRRERGALHRPYQGN